MVVTIELGCDSTASFASLAEVMGTPLNSDRSSGAALAVMLMKLDGSAGAIATATECRYFE